MMQVMDSILTVILIILALLTLVCMIKAVIGPRVGDRIVCVNMMGTMVMTIIAILAIKMKEGYLVDICIIYAMISFLAVVVLCKVYMGVYAARRERIRSKQRKEDVEASANESAESTMPVDGKQGDESKNGTMECSEKEAK